MTDKQIIITAVVGPALVLIVAAVLLRPVPKSKEAASVDPAASSPQRATPPSSAPPTHLPPNLQNLPHKLSPAPILMRPTTTATLTTRPAPPLDKPARLEAALATLRQRAPGFGFTEAVLAAREQELGQPIPYPARRLLAAVSPRAWGRFVSSIRLERPGNCKFQSTPYGDLADRQPELARGGPFFIFAAGEYGDGIVLDAAGRVLLADHEDSIAVLADSLAAWIERLIAFNGTEYAYVRGEVASLPPERRRTFLMDHQRLNPDSEWAARQLMALDFPGGHPLGHHVWDPATRRLLPAAEAPPTRLIQIQNVSQRDIDTVTGAKGCNDLMIVGADGGEALDLSPLSKMTTLTDLYVYDVADVDARQLAAHPALADLCFLRCRVTNIAALAKVSTLKRLRLNECRTDEADFARFRALRPEVKLE